MIHRKEFNAENIDIDDLETDLKSGKVIFHGTDKGGHPIVVVKIRLHMVKETTVEKTF